MMSRRCAVHFAICFWMLAAGLMWGQIRSGTITGVVTDASRATVPQAEVTVRNQDTNVAQTAQTNAAGEFTVSYLAAGRYEVGVRKAGFKAYEQTDIAVTTGQTVRADIALAVGALEASVEVVANATQLQSEASNVQGAVDTRVIESIPNITQNPLNYVLLQAGVVSKTQMLDSAGPDSVGVGYNARRNFSAFSINGGQAFTNDIQMDGLTIQGSAWNEVTVLPNTDGIQEVRVVSNNFTAEYGRGQGVIAIASKSGTNQIHGSGSFRMRNEGLNANTFANNARSIARPKFRLNEYSGTVGGPVVIPKVFNGKDRLFFFTSLQRMTHNDTAEWMGTVPTDLERQGDFSQTLAKVPHQR
jgi:trimeric autotransporter adhesin